MKGGNHMASYSEIATKAVIAKVKLSNTIHEILLMKTSKVLVVGLLIISLNVLI